MFLPSIMVVQMRGPVYDKQFVMALFAGGVVWFGLWQWNQPSVDLSWPLREPLRFMLLAVVYPVLEEIIFRGGLQQSLLKHARGRLCWHGVTVANLVTSIVFTAMHLFVHVPAWAAATFFPSLAYGYFRDRYRSLWAPIWLHAFYNTGYFLIFAY